LLVIAGIGAVVVIGGIVGVLALRTSARSRPVAIAPATATATATSTVSLPPVTRHVPHHPRSILDGCGQGDRDALADGIGDAISVGAPLYNGGNFAGCYHLYDGTAADLERKLSTECVGPGRALEEGRTRAASLASPDAQAWAMRDAFDGLLEVLERR
jgi:hypothetical protein